MMHTNHYFFRLLAPILQAKLEGSTFSVAFSQDKDELVLAFDRGPSSFFIKALLSAQFSSLVFPDQFERARRNSVDLWTELYGASVERVWVPDNERVLVISLSGDLHLVGKFHGNRPNWLVFKGEGLVYVFNNHLKSDYEWMLSTLSRPIDQNFPFFEANGGDISKVYPTLGKWLIVQFEHEEWYRSADLGVRWAGWQEVIRSLEAPAAISIGTDAEGLPFFSLLPKEGEEHYSDPLAAINAYVARFQQVYTLAKERSAWIRRLEREIRQTEAYLAQQYQRLDDREKGLSLEQTGHILMANLHQIPAEVSEISLVNLYAEDTPVLIKLKPDYSPQKNAEWYYRKAKNERIEKEKLVENILAREETLVLLKKQVQEIAHHTSIRSLRTYVKKELQPSIQHMAGESSLFKQYNVLGYEILVGRNAKNNDLLTQRYAFKEDLWLHARDVQGSHVIIKHQAGKPFPTPVIEAAASLAAYYSKSRNERLAAVIVTPKKFVRKGKGLADGAVIIDKEKVVMVPPRGDV